MGRTESFRGSTRPSRGLSAIVLTGLAALLLSACGSSPSSGATSSGSTSVNTSTTTTTGISGSRSLTLGTKDSPEEFILGQLYKQALEAKGFKVNYKENIGASEILDKALTSGQIDAYPEYTGKSVASVAKINKIVSSPQQEYALAKTFYAHRGQAVSQMTPFFDTDAIALLKSYARKHGLNSIADLKRLSHFILGARPEFLNRKQGAARMKRVYGLNNFTVKSLALEVQYQALDSGAVDAIDVFSTDPQLASGEYTVLSDPKTTFGFQNAALVIDQQKLAQLGGEKFLSIINEVNSLLTTPAVTVMNKEVAIDGQAAAIVANSFLKANGLI